MSLQGWEVKSLRAGKINLTEAYVTLKGGEAFLFGATISPLPTASTHIQPDPMRTRKLLLHREELNELIGLVERKGYHPGAHWRCTGNAAAPSSRSGSPRARSCTTSAPTPKERDWQREKQRNFKNG